MKRSVERVNGVVDVAFDLRAGSATVTFKPDTKIDEGALRTAIKKAGFTVERVEINNEDVEKASDQAQQP